jgi:hypothetical protein
MNIILTLMAALGLATTVVAQDAKITSNRWESDTLIVSGTLSNPNGWPIEFVGFDKNQQTVTRNNDYTIQPDGTFRATLSDAKREIKFVKVEFVSVATATARTRDLQIQANASRALAAPVATLHTDTNSSGGVFIGLLIGGIILAPLCFVIKFISSICNVASNQSLPLPPPTPSESANQELALADLGKGDTPNRYQLDGFLPKKGENVIWAFVGVKHYRQGTHSEWVGRSSGASVRVFKGFWVRSGANRGHKVSHSEMDYQGAGTLVLTTIGLCFIGANSTRIPLSHILAFQPYTDGIGFDTDYARNNRHVFTRIHAGNVAFIQTVLDIIKAA